MTSSKKFQDAIVIYTSSQGSVSTDDVADACVDELDDLVLAGVLDKIDDEEYTLSERGKARLESLKLLEE